MKLIILTDSDANVYAAAHSPVHSPQQITDRLRTAAEPLESLLGFELYTHEVEATDLMGALEQIDHWIDECRRQDALGRLPKVRAAGGPVIDMGGGWAGATSYRRRP